VVVGQALSLSLHSAPPARSPPGRSYARVGEACVADCSSKRPEQPFNPGQRDLDSPLLFTALQNSGYTCHDTNAFGRLDDMPRVQSRFAENTMD